MSIFTGMKNLLFSDFLPIYRLMPLGIRRKILFVFFLMGILAILEACSILSLSFLALSVAAPDKVMSLPFVGWFFEKFPFLKILQADVRIFALWISALVAGLTIGKNIASSLVTIRSAALGETVALYAGDTLFQYYLHSPYLAYLAGQTNSIFQVISWRAQLGFFLVNLMQVYTYIVISVALFLILISATPEILLLTLGIVGVLCFAIYRGLKRSVDSASKKSAEYANEEYLATENAKRGMMEVHIYRQQEYFFNAFHNAGEEATKSRAFITASPPMPTLILESVAFLVIPATLWLMVELYDASMPRITSVLTMIMLASWRILPLLNRSMTNMVALRGAHYPMQMCLQMLRYIKDNPLPEEPAAKKRLEFDTGIVFDNVSFGYPAVQEDCLRGVSFRLRKGMSLGIIGRSGAGKSTLANILSGLVSPRSGAMLVDGKELSPTELAEYRLGVGYVSQSPYLLQGTLAQNVAFSQWGRPYDPERVWHVCRLAQLDIVNSHSLGIDLPIGEGGTGLSGGQAQRLSIARALYAFPQLLILDEATSSLDLGVEATIIETIASLSKSITTVVIAHRLSTVEWCDALLWLNEGRVAGYGVPHEVLPKYRQYLGVGGFEEASGGERPRAHGGDCIKEPGECLANE
jgi:ABC-type multidrug transport system fused ATPase/permease subunit